MLVLGVGIGCCMQILTIIVQSTVDYHDLGVATSGVTFFRTLGSAFGAAIFGTVFANVLRDRLPAAVAASPGIDPAAISSPSALHAYPAETIGPIVNAYAETIQVVFRSAVPVAAVAFVLALFLKEVPLRGSARAAAKDVGEGFGMPEGGDSARQLQLAIARLFRSNGGWQAFRAIREESGTALTGADAWCVAQVHLREAADRTTSLEAIAGRVHVPPSVLRPAFDETRRAGFIAGGEEALTLTDLGNEEIEKFVGTTRAWLTDQMADWGIEDHALEAALREMARQFVDQDAELYSAPVPVGASGSS
jgi:hypothetical protein